MVKTHAYILHTRAWRETSLLVDAITDSYGRVSLIAKGAKRPHSTMRGMLEPFIPLTLEISGKTELKNLIQAHWTQPPEPLHPAHSMAAWYLNELCLRGTQEADPHTDLFTAYDTAIQELRKLDSISDSQSILRVFEYEFLKLQGLWPAFEGAIDRSLYYTLNQDQHWQIATLDNAVWCVKGATLIALFEGRQDIIADDGAGVRTLMRTLLTQALHYKILNTRVIWQELDKLPMPFISQQ